MPGAGWEKVLDDGRFHIDDYTHDVVGLASLASGGISGFPSDSNGIATMVDVQSCERDLRLRSLGTHKVLTAAEGDAVDLDWSLVAPVADDVDRRRIVFKVRCESIESESLRVVLDELAEDLGALLRLLVGYATAIAASSVLNWSCRCTWVGFIGAASRVYRWSGGAGFNCSCRCAARSFVGRQSESERGERGGGDECGETHLARVLIG